MPYVDLQRRFIALADDREETLTDRVNLPAFLTRPRETPGWSDVLCYPRVVVLGEAGAGKTEELKAQRDRLRSEDSFAVVLPVEALADGGVEACCTPDELAAFEAWRAAAPVDGFESVPPGWFFLDAIDEAKLTGKRFSAALSRLAHALGQARDRAHVVITSRVTDWRPGADLEEVARWLPPPPRAAVDPAVDAPVDVFLDEGADAIEPQWEDAPERTGGVRVFALAPLRREQVERLARDGAGLADADAFLQALDEADLWDLVSRPLDALDLARFWRANRRLESRARTLDWIIGKRLSEHNEAHERVPGAPTPANARRLAARLAAALTFARRRTIALPDADPSFAGTDSIDPAEVLDEITAAERVRLLSTALFDPASYGRARFHHREVEEFLTAEWLHARLQAGMPHGAVLDLLLPTRAGLRVAPETLRPALAWLALRDDRICEAALAHAPAVLLQHGDPSSLPLAQRERLLEAYAEKLGHEPWARELSFTVVARLAKPDLADAIRRLWPPGVARTALRDLLTIAIGRGRIAACADLAASIAVAPEADETSRTLAIDAVARTGDGARAREIASALAGEGVQTPWRVAVEAIEELFPASMTVAQFCGLLPALRAKPDGHLTGLDMGRTVAAYAIDSHDDLRAFAWRIATELRGQPNRGYARILRPLLLPAAVRMAQELGELAPADANAILFARSRGSREGRRKEYEEALEAALSEREDFRPSLFREAVRLREETKETSTPDGVWMVLWTGAQDEDISWLLPMIRPGEPRELRERALRNVVDIWRRNDDRILLDEIAREISDDSELAKLLAAWTQPRDAASEEFEEDTAPEIEDARTEFVRRRIDLRDRLRAALSSDGFDPTEPLGVDDSLLVAVFEFMWEREETSLVLRTADLAGALGSLHARRLRDVFIARWRRSSIRLRAEGRDEDSYADWIAASGLAMALADAPDLPASFSADEAESALRICLFSAFDYRLPLATLATRFSRLARGLLTRELEWETAQGETRLLDALTQAPADAFAALVTDDLIASLESRPDLRPAPRTAIDDLLYRIEGRDRPRLARLALDRLSTSPMPDDARFWWRLAFSNDARAAMRRLHAELDHTDAVGRCGLLHCVLPAIHREYEGEKYLELDRLADIERIAALLDLLLLAFDLTPPADYPDHRTRFDSGGGRMVARRAAPEIEIGDAREALFDALAAIPGDDTVAALLALAERFAGEPFAHRFRRAAERRATADAEPGWAARDVVAVEQEQDLVPRTGDELFALVVRRLDGIAGDLVDGDSSYGPLLAQLDRARGADKDHQPVQRETIVQHWVATQLRERARDRYAVPREPEVAGGKKPDILVLGRHGAPAEVAVEIKIADDWSVRELEDALLVQLREQYLRPADRRHGVLLLVHLDPGRMWQNPDGGDAMTFPALVARLTALADATRANASGAVTLAVAAIDAARFVEKARALKAKAAARRRKASTGEPTA